MSESRRLLRLLAPESYTPALWDLRHDEVQRQHWSEVFRQQLADMVRLVAEQNDAEASARATRVEHELRDWLDRLDAAELTRRPHVHSWTRLREGLLAAHGLPNPYQATKVAENRVALGLLPEALARIRAEAPGEARLRRSLCGVFAGNLFDLGAPLTARAHRSGELGFAHHCEPNADRPWLIDHQPELSRRLAAVAPRRVVILVDNAGTDFVCGVLPLAMLLASLGAEVALAANATPALNDVTATEAAVLVKAAAALDPELAGLVASGQLTVISSGNGAPGIDLREVSPALDRAVTAADLVILEGMGRAVETNWRAVLAVPVLRLAVLKDAEVAAELGGEVYAAVCDLRAPGEGPPRR